MYGHTVEKSQLKAYNYNTLYTIGGIKMDRITMYSINGEEVGYCGVLLFKEYKKLILEDTGATKFLKVRTNKSYITPVHWHYIKLKIFLKRIKLTRNIDAADIML